MSPTVLPDTTTETTGKVEIEPIKPYKVILLNDDVTTMDFVVYVLTSVFKKDQMTAMGIMLEIHNQGSAIVSVLSKEEAELRQQQCHSMAQEAGFPLRCVIEPA